ncbi:MAG TPA: hypothetical protein VMU50_01170 [Polyangia bacterium]|nr:hypothetical protein [Polyangia bacterium]
MLLAGVLAAPACTSPSALHPVTGTGGASDSGGSGGHGSGGNGGGGAPGSGGMVDSGMVFDGTFCSLGTPVPNAKLPSGFCARLYTKLAEPRTLALAPNGDIFVGAPSDSPPGGASGGPGAIVVLSDDNHDGIAEQSTFLSDGNNVHGLAIGGGYLYFTRGDFQMGATMVGADVWRTPYTTGQRKEVGPREALHLPTSFGDGGRWTHGLARSPVGGQVIVSRGEYGSCGNSMGGEISRVETGGALTTLAAAFRNPMYLRCHFTDEVCAATELGEDLATGAVEKFLIVKMGTNYGYPCCFDRNMPSSSADATQCAAVTPEEASFPLSQTPFGFDWERGLWPEPYRNGIFVALHGSAYSNPPWEGARVVFAPASSTTHAPMGDWRAFMDGFANYNGDLLKRPSDIVFSPDGRMFIADDEGGLIYWVAPTSLPAPQ